MHTWFNRLRGPLAASSAAGLAGDMTVGIDESSQYRHHPVSESRRQNSDPLIILRNLNDTSQNRATAPT